MTELSFKPRQPERGLKRFEFWNHTAWVKIVLRKIKLITGMDLLLEQILECKSSINVGYCYLKVSVKIYMVLFN